MLLSFLRARLLVMQGIAHMQLYSCVTVLDYNIDI